MLVLISFYTNHFDIPSKSSPNRLFLFSGICGCWTDSHTSSLLFHPTSTPDLPLLETAAVHNMPFTCRCTTQRSFYLLKCIQVDFQITCCREDTDKQTYFSEASGAFLPEHALFTGRAPRDYLGICLVDFLAGPLRTLSFEWSSL